MCRERRKIVLRFGGKVLEESFGAARPTDVVPVQSRRAGHAEFPTKRRFTVSRPCFDEIALVAIGLKCITVLVANQLQGAHRSLPEMLNLNRSVFPADWYAGSPSR